MITNFRLFVEHLRLVEDAGLLTMEYIEKKASEWAEIEKKQAAYHYKAGQQGNETPQQYTERIYGHLRKE